MPTTSDVVEVIQADRDAAASLIEALVKDQCLVAANAWASTAEVIRLGAWHPLVQAFARHRLAAQTPPDSGAVGELVERLRESASELGGRNGEWVEHHLAIPADGEALDAAQAMSEAADALTSLLAENFRLAAGQCTVENGLIGDEHGHFGCSLQARVEQLSAALASIRDHDGVSYRFGDEVREIARTALSPTTGEGKYGNGPTGGEPG